MSLREGDGDDGFQVSDETRVIIVLSSMVSLQEKKSACSAGIHRRVCLEMELGLGGNYGRAMEELMDGRVE